MIAELIYTKGAGVYLLRSIKSCIYTLRGVILVYRASAGDILHITDSERRSNPRRQNSLPQDMSSQNAPLRYGYPIPCIGMASKYLETCDGMGRGRRLHSLDFRSSRIHLAGSPVGSALCPASCNTPHML